ncbi:TPA: hypothetical protein N0F65_003231, partial [Lagenidium giganteum]
TPVQDYATAFLLAGHVANNHCERETVPVVQARQVAWRTLGLRTPASTQLVAH